MADADVKPQNQSITIRVKDPQGKEVIFKVKRSTTFAKIFSAFEQKQGVQKGTFRYQLDTNKLAQLEQTPDDVGMEEGDVIEAFSELTGGNV